MASQLSVVDLFAGCGGLSLGLELAGFRPIFVNELNHDALATYIANRRHVAPYLQQPEFHCNDVKHLVLGKGEHLQRLAKRFKSYFKLSIPNGDLDLLVGGPPCQGFSGIGHRRSYSVDKEQLPSNHLFEDMVYVICKLKPKIFLFENVKGLLSARWTSEGEKGEIWLDVKRTFHETLSKHYVMDSALVLAKNYGVPQNRPRVLMVGLRKDLKNRIKLDPLLTASGLLPQPTPGNAPDLINLLGDLVDGMYSNGGCTDLYPHEAMCDIQEYFRLDPDSKEIRRKGAVLTEHKYSHHTPHIVEKFRHMIKNGGEIPKHLRTKKFAQRVLPKRWGKDGPTITATSLPDDYVHFLQPRSLTVREWARLQMFPDWYEFKGKRTTGGIRRAGNPPEGIFEREAPKYTQIGNAVPVKLATEVGLHFRRILGQ